MLICEELLSKKERKKGRQAGKLDVLVLVL
jgi:hypothetical protein